MLVKKLFKLLSLLRLFQELRHGLRAHRHGYGSPVRRYRGDHWHPRSRSYPPLYRRPRKPKLSHLVSTLLGGRRH
jgi:hypothetical protein